MSSSQATLRPGVRADIIDAVQSVFIVAAPIAGAAFLIVLLLQEVPLRGSGGAPRPDGGEAKTSASHGSPA